MITYLLEYNRYMNVIGILLMLLLSVILSGPRRRFISLRLVAITLAMQGVIGYSILRFSAGRAMVQSVADAVSVLYGYARYGSQFMFGSLTDPSGSWGFIFAVNVLPVIIFFSALTALMFHWGVIQKLVHSVAYIVRPILRTSGPETTCAIANSVLSQTEAPLLIKRYLSHMNESQIFVVMLSGMATISASILAVYAAMGVPAVHMLASSVMSIPGALLVAKIIYPETTKSPETSLDEDTQEAAAGNMFEAIAVGTSDGLMMALHIGAMLISFLALIALGNGLLGYISAGITLQSIFAWLCAPFGYLLGFTGTDALIAGRLIGTKIAVNELFAYSDMVALNLAPRMNAVLTYALCGFSNFSCIGIQIASIGALAPNQKKVITRLGITAVLGAAISNIITACMAGLLL